MEKQSIDRDDYGFFNKDFLNEKDLMKDSCFSHFEAFYSSSESPFRLIKARKNGRVFILKTLKEEVRETDADGYQQRIEIRQVQLCLAEGRGIGGDQIERHGGHHH